MSTNNLKPCPFCGGDPKYGRVDEGENFGGEYIECSNPLCGCSTNLMFPAMDEVKSLLAEKWNCRQSVETVRAQLSGGIALITAERQRQIREEGWTAEHDDKHDMGELAKAAACYAVGEQIIKEGYGYSTELWPWDTEWWNPSSDPIRNLTKAGALIAAEIDRLLRKAKS